MEIRNTKQINELESINQDLQASYGILKLMEKSNIYSEDMLNSLPCIFAVINEEGEILKGNIKASERFNTDPEGIFRKKFSNLFKKETWNIFNNNLKKIIDEKLLLSKFELGLQDEGSLSGEKAYYWFIKRMGIKTESEGHIAIIVGEDISQLRESEKKLSEIFSSIPLGIFTINANGIIEEFYSSYSEHLLNQMDMAGKPFIDVLFLPVLGNMKKEEKDGIDCIKACLGQNKNFFEMMLPFFPKQILYPINSNVEEGRWLKIIYQPVYYENVIKRLLIILEDQTEIAKAEEIKKRAKMLDDQSITRILQIKQADQEILPILMKEMHPLIKRLLEQVQEDSNIKSICSNLHSIKGAARVAGFEKLKEMSHNLESILLGAMSFELIDDYVKQINEIEIEFKELNSLYKALFQYNENSAKGLSDANISKEVIGLFEKYNSIIENQDSTNIVFESDRILLALQSLQYSDLSDLEKSLNIAVKTTAKKLNKLVRLHFQWNNIPLNKNTISTLNECLIHLLNNAIDHGIELPEIREKQISIN